VPVIIPISRGNIEVFMDFVVRKAVELHYSNDDELLKTREVSRNLLSGADASQFRSIHKYQKSS